MSKSKNNGAPKTIETENWVEDIFNPYNVNAKPFLKWAGGKSQLLKVFRMLYPEGLSQGMITEYFEPFLGSGAVFFDVAQKFNIKKAYLYDLNPDLILTYQVIQRHVGKLINTLKELEKRYYELDTIKRNEFYYQKRETYNLERLKINFNEFSPEWIEHAALFIFLNRTCYNGLFRVNSKGEFNSPAGRYSNPTICDEVNLLAVNKVLQLAEIKMGDFSIVTNDIKFPAESFVYFDPPYRPLSKTSNFTSYYNNGFNDFQQKRLADLFAKLDDMGVSLMLSNSDPKNVNPSDNFFDELYRNFNIMRTPANRMINSVAAKRGVINELIITNYYNKAWRKAQKEIKQGIF
ncbi:MAG: DNA adenine methylase [Bacteroidales bacterium]